MPASLAAERPDPVNKLFAVPDQLSRPVWWTRRSLRDAIRIADGAMVVLGAGLAAVGCTQGGALPIHFCAITQMAVISAVVTVSGLDRGGLYRDDGLEDHGIEPIKILGALLVGCLAAIGLVVPDAPKTATTWLWAIPWILASFGLLLGTRILARPMWAQLVAACAAEHHCGPPCGTQEARYLASRLAPIGPFDEWTCLYADGCLEDLDDRLDEPFEAAAD